MVQRPRLLILDDEILVTMMLEDIVVDLDFEVVGPFSRLEEGLLAAKCESLDGAIIDLNLGRGVFSTPVADVLRDRGIPFVIATGYGATKEIKAMKASSLLTKPFTTEDVKIALASLIT
mgnify:FL=1